MRKKDKILLPIINSFKNIDNKKIKGELKKINKHKRGRSYKYPKSLFFVASLFFSMGLQYRAIEGVLKVILEQKNIPVPDYTTIFRRMQKLKISWNFKINSSSNSVIIDASGFEATQRSEWLRFKHKKGKIKTRKGFVKLHMIIDRNTKHIISYEITDENKADISVAKDLIKNALKQLNITKLFGDGAYHSYELIYFLTSQKIKPIIRLPKNSIISPSNTNNKYINRRRSLMHPRYKMAREQKDLDIWKKENNYGTRWNIEGKFSAIKRRFDSFIRSRTKKTARQELTLKLFWENLFNYYRLIVEGYEDLLLLN